MWNTEDNSITIQYEGISFPEDIIAICEAAIKKATDHAWDMDISS